MSLKPGTLCKLKKGQLIDAQPGFVDTFNWMVDFINNLKGGDGIELDVKQSDRPIIKLKGGGELNLISGDHTKVEFTKVESGKDKGKYKLDVYYK